MAEQEDATERLADSPELQPEVFERLELLDVDRTLFRTERFSQLIGDVCQQQGIDRAELEARKTAVEASGRSFDTIFELRRLYEPAVANTIVQQIRLEAQNRQTLDDGDEKCLFYPGAREIINQISPPHVKRTFLTRGGEETQLLKLEALGIHFDQDLYAVVPLEHARTKAEMCVDSFDAETDLFTFRWLRTGRPTAGEAGALAGARLVDIQTATVMVVDDKPSELRALGQLERSKAVGYLIRTGDGKRSQAMLEGETLPENIYPVQSLVEIGQFLSRIGTIALGRDKGWSRR